MTQASVPAPRTWSADNLVTVPRLRADVVNAVAFLRQRPLFIGQNTTGASFASGTSGLGLNAELVDSWNGHLTQSAGSALTSQYWAAAAGWYLVRCSPTWNYTSTTPILVAGGLQGVTGGTPWTTQWGALGLAGSGAAPVAQCCDLVEMTATGPPGGSGDWVQFLAQQGSGSAVNLEAAAVQLPTCSARWVCAVSGTQPLPVPPLTGVPNPITSAWLNANVRDTIRVLTYPPICRAIVAAGSSTLASQAFPAGSTVPVNSATVDNYGGFSASTHLYTAPLSGRYYVYGQANLAASSAATAYGCGISISGGTTMWGDVLLFAPSASSAGGASVSRRVRLTAGQTIGLVANQGSGGAIAYNTSGANSTRLIVVWEGI